MSAQTQPPMVALSSAGLDITRRFHEVDSLTRQVGDAKHREWPRALFSAESERFELWAVNMGLFVPGHGSLDYRVRDAASLKSTLAKFMTDLNDSLTQGCGWPLLMSLSNWALPLTTSLPVLRYCNGAFDVNVSLDHPDDDPDDVLAAPALVQPSTQRDSAYALVGEADSDIDLLVDSVRDPIDRLYKLSTRIRNPSTRFASSNAQHYRKIDPESNCDFLKAAEPFDHDYISSLFLQYRKASALHHAPVVEPSPASVEDGAKPESDTSDDMVWEPIRSVLSRYREEMLKETESFLVHRLARANSQRRRQFAYWARHREKLILHTRRFSQEVQVPIATAMAGWENTGPHAAESSAPVLIPAESVTTATRLQVAQLAVRDDQSTVSYSEYAPSTHASEDAVDFPLPPKRKGNEKYFECPYCFTLCSLGSLGLRAWKAHLIRDLRPYVCTYETCRNPDQLYDTREDWIQHENTSHRTTWCCRDHPDVPFSRVAEYQAHLAEYHGADVGAEHSSALTRAGETCLAVADRCCPVCNFSAETANDLHKHIALHLERIALFSLPHVGGDDDDDRNEAGSQSVNLPDDGTRDGDSESSSQAGSELYDDVFDNGEYQQAKSAAGIARQRWNSLLDAVCHTQLGFDRADRLRGARSFQSPLRGMHDQAASLATQGRLREAEELYSEILQVRVRAFGRKHPRTLTSMAELAAIYEREGLKKRADELLAEVAQTRLQLASERLIGAANLALPYRNQAVPGETEELERRLMSAAEMDRQRRQQQQQQQQGDPSTREMSSPAHSVSDYQAKLLEAVRTGNQEVVQLLLSIEGVNPDGRDSNDRTPLSWAAGFGDAALVRLFLATPGVDADFADCRGQTPLSWAADCGHTDVVALLLASGRVDPDSKDASGWTPLAWAASKGYDAVVRLLLARDDVDANSRSESGLTPLAWAVVNGYPEVVKAFLSSGRASLDYDGSSGRTLLEYSRKSGNEAVVEMIEDALEEGEEPNSQSDGSK